MTQPDVVVGRKRKAAFPWRWARRASQVAALVLLAYLFRKTEYSGSDNLTLPVDLLFQLDPLVSATAMLAGKVLVSGALIGLAVLLATWLLGRFFCGWICPLGTLLDATGRAVGWAVRPLQRRMRKPLQSIRGLRFAVLGLVLIAAACGLSLIGFVDPFSLLVRPATFWLDPQLSLAADTVTNPTLSHYLRKYLLAGASATYALAGVSALLLLGILLLEALSPRFWCRYVCPTGALLALPARYALLKRTPKSQCGKCPAACGSCADTCRMGAFNADNRFVAESCNLCMDCSSDCPTSLAKFTFRRPKGSTASTSRKPVDLSRRAFVSTVAAGVALPAIVKASRLGVVRGPNPSLVRPPGSEDEDRFLDLCVRCGLCMKVCPTNGLQPATLEAGLDGLFTPMLDTARGYCEFNCTLCQQVCPTGAIPMLSLETKQTTPMAKAVIDRHTCLPWAKAEECICCEEHCPLPEKAISYRVVETYNSRGDAVTLQRPFVLLDKCIGCGICVNKCPVEKKPAIVLRRLEYFPPPARK